jgi:hypothetical protein
VNTHRLVEIVAAALRAERLDIVVQPPTVVMQRQPDGSMIATGENPGFLIVKADGRRWNVGPIKDIGSEDEYATRR